MPVSRLDLVLPAAALVLTFGVVAGVGQLVGGTSRPPTSPSPASPTPITPTSASPTPAPGTATTAATPPRAEVRVVLTDLALADPVPGLFELRSSPVAGTPRRLCLTGAAGWAPARPAGWSPDPDGVLCRAYAADGSGALTISLVRS